MDDGSLLTWFVLAALILAAMYFAFAETAFASVSRNRLKAGADRGDPRAKNALFVTEHMERAITTILIGTNIVHLAAASVVTVYVTKRWGVSFVTLSTLLTTLAVFFFGEMLPKSIARKYSERFALGTAGSLRTLMVLFRPLSAALAAIGDTASRIFKGEPEVSVTEDELYDIIEDMTEEGTLDEEQGDLISSAISFGEVTVESILTSRVDVAALDVEAPTQTVLAFIKGQPHSRIPVYEGTIDHIVGILQIRKYIKEYIRGGRELSIRPLLDEPFFVHQSMKIDDLLTVMSREQLNMAVVTDNYGGTLGIVTVEDILEELVGDIWDEEDSAVSSIAPLKDGSYSVSADESVEDVLDALDIDLSEEENERVTNKLMSELVYEHFPNIPKEGDVFRDLGLKIRVQSMRGNRIMRVRVRPMPRKTGTESTQETEGGGA